MSAHSPSARSRTDGGAAPWRDWLLSVLLHALALGSGWWMVSYAPSPRPLLTIDLPLQWAEQPPAPPPVAEPLPPDPPPPAPVPKQAAPKKAPAPPALRAEPVQSPAPEAPAADVAVPTAPQAAQPEAPAPAPASRAAGQVTWRATFESMLLRKKRYPMTARRMRQQGSVMVQASFSAQGALLDCSVISSSGFASLDAAALQLVREAAAAATARIQPESTPAPMRIPIEYELKET